MKQNDLFMDSSILYRTTQKYFDRELQQFKLTYAQLPVLIMVYENEGISMQEIAFQGKYDKGTITKNVQKLESLGYLEVIHSSKDKRSKELYTTLKAKEIMSNVYEVRRNWWKQLNANMTDQDIEQFSHYFLNLSENAKKLVDFNDTSIKFYYHQKVNLNIYPNKIATVFYTGGCNFQCKTCFHPEYVFIRQNMQEIKEEDIYSFLQKRNKMIQAICICGGEPCMHPQLSEFLSYGKSLGYKICISTNGSYPDTLKSWIEDELVDYVILNIKQAPEFYSQAIGLNEYNCEKIEETIQYLKKNNLDYRFEITLNHDIHDSSKVQAMAKWLKSDTECILYSWNVEDESMKQYEKIFKTYLPNTKIGDLK